MINKKFLILFLGIFLIGVVSASYCCEKTLAGAWCMNAEKYECDEEGGLKMSPTSCDATSYCKLGTCINNEEGTCSPNTAQKTCAEENGYWKEGKPENIEQCQKGCCLMGDNAAFITQTRCKMFASLYSVNVDFRTNIQSELQCIASATSDVKGACVFDKGEGMKTCKFVKQSECTNAGGKFYQDYLCSAESLGTNCAKSPTTTCLNEKVYFLDTCGNIANIYDYSRRDDPTYWATVIEPEDSCNYGDSNADDSKCGNCDYFLGSTCVAYKRGQDNSPTIGNYICRNLGCKYEDKTYEHGEKWCVVKSSGANDLPGSQHYVLECRNNEVLVEPCDARRATVCVQDDVEGFTSAQCVANEWQDCVSQNNERDCLNNETGDCEWVKDYDFGTYNYQGKGVCVPKYAPGFDSGDETAGEICSAGTVTCVVKKEKGLLAGTWKSVENGECSLEDGNHKNWLSKMEKVCSSLGDCGSSVNYIGQKGYNILNATKV